MVGLGTVLTCHKGNAVAQQSEIVYCKPGTQLQEAYELQKAQLYSLVSAQGTANLDVLLSLPRRSQHTFTGHRLVFYGGPRHQAAQRSHGYWEVLSRTNVALPASSE
jgi:hypothetical protein